MKFVMPENCRLVTGWLIIQTHKGIDLSMLNRTSKGYAVDLRHPIIRELYKQYGLEQGLGYSFNLSEEQRKQFDIYALNRLGIRILEMRR